MQHETESSPLLRHSSNRVQEGSMGVPKDRRFLHQNSPLFICCICALVLFMVEVGGIMQNTPLTQVTEEIVCHNFAHRQSASNDRCKEADVQSELSSIQAWRSTVDTIPGLLMAIPYGIAADKYGHSLVLGFSLTGMSLSSAANTVICAFPAIFHIRLLWVTPIFTLIGGGGTVFTAMLFSIVNNVSNEAQRSTAFFYIWGCIFVGEIVSNSLTYYIMERDIWYAIYLGLSIQVAATLIAYATPNTRGKNAESTRDPPCSQPDSSDESALTKPQIYNLISHFGQATQKLLALLRWIVSENRSLGLLLLTVLFTSLGQYAKVLELQYITKRYQLSWSRAGLLLSSRTISSILLYLIILPLAGNLLLVKNGLSPSAKDLLLARVSLVLMTTGAFVIGFAGNLALLVVGTVVLSIGSGYHLLVRSLLSSLVMEHHAGMLYTSIGVLENISQLVAGPLISTIFRIGLAWGDPWVGLPYLVVSIFYAFSLFVVWFVDLESTKYP